ncbi:MAG TPA: hypothetical protein VFV71_06620 [Burkholderiales bacterium]|nr:hypothetical protein [Burkholderiales bacterium]
MTHLVLLLVHLFAVLVFAGTVFFEVLFLGSVRRRLPRELMRQIEEAIGTRARSLMPWVLALLFGSGIAMAWDYRATLLPPATPFAWLLSLKILLALSVFGHFLTAMAWHRRGVLTGRRSRRLHLSVFCHVVAIVVLAKGMFYA